MKMGFIGAGKAGCSLGRYFSEKTLPDFGIAGFYSKKSDDALWAAQFTRSNYFASLKDVVSETDIIVISTQDSVVNFVWKALPKETLRDKIVCHLSGSLSSDVFSDRKSYGIHGISVHPLFAFSNKESVYQQLQKVCFTLEGDSFAVNVWQKLLTDMGNPTLQITKEHKTKYHAAASLLSNHVLAVLECGYQLLQECGFEEAQTRSFTADLVMHNVEQAVRQGTMDALTGPIERCDAATVEKHLSQLTGHARELYLCCGRELVTLAQHKNLTRDYSAMQALLTNCDK